VHENDADAARRRKNPHGLARSLERIDAEMQHGYDACRDDQRNPVAVEQQKGEQHENREMYFDHPVSLMYLQCGKDHQRRGNGASRDERAAICALKPCAYGPGGKPDDEGFGPRVVPRRQRERCEQQCRQHPQEQPIRGPIEPGKVDVFITHDAYPGVSIGTLLQKEPRAEIFRRCCEVPSKP
jgi:hypothetical protein